MLHSVSLTQEQANSTRSQKTPIKITRNDKSVGKTREQSNEKDKLVKTKTVANLKNFTNIAKNIKNENKNSKTPTNANKSSIFTSEKDGLTSVDTTWKNKTFFVEKKELKREKSKAKIVNKEESI